MFLDLTERLERLHSSRLVLRPVCLSDAWPLFQATRAPVFNQHLAWDQPSGLDAVIERVNAIMTASRQGRITAMSAVLKSTGAWVSLFRFLPWERDPKAVEVGIWTHVDYWHGRYSLELGRMCVDAAFVETPVDRVVGLSLPENRGSCQLMEAVGMLPTGEGARVAENGRRLQVVEYQLSRSRWMQRVGSGVSYDSVDCDDDALADLEKGYRVVDAEPCDTMLQEASVNL